MNEIGVGGNLRTSWIEIHVLAVVYADLDADSTDFPVPTTLQIHPSNESIDLELIVLNRNMVIFIIIFVGKRENMLYKCGMDIFADKVGNISDNVFFSK